MVLRFAADLAAQALVMSLDTQLSTASDSSTAAIIARPSSRKARKKQRMPSSERRHNDDDQTSTAPSGLLTLSSSPSQSSRLVTRPNTSCFGAHTASTFFFPMYVVLAV